MPHPAFERFFLPPEATNMKEIKFADFFVGILNGLQHQPEENAWNIASHAGT